MNKRTEKGNQLSRERRINRYQSQEYAVVEIIKDFKIGVITMLHDIKVNTPEMNENIEILGRETENEKRTKVNLRIEKQNI